MRTTKRNVTRGEIDGHPTMVTSGMHHQRKARTDEQEAEGSHRNKTAHPLTCVLGLSQFSDSDQSAERWFAASFRRKELTPPWQIHTVMTPTVLSQRPLQPFTWVAIHQGKGDS